MAARQYSNFEMFLAGNNVIGVTRNTSIIGVPTSRAPRPLVLVDWTRLAEPGASSAAKMGSSGNMLSRQVLIEI